MCRQSIFLYYIKILRADLWLSRKFVKLATHMDFSIFFEMPLAEKEELFSDDVRKPVRFQHVNRGDYSKDFLKLYAHPLEHFISYWPSFPPDYREKMGIYSTEVRKLCIELFGAIMESLSLDQTHLKQEFKQGFQILGVNCYNRCTESSTKNGTPPHTDHSVITLLLQSAPGLDFMDPEGSWKSIPKLKGSLQVFVGDHLEVISNGFYKSVLHRAINSSNGAARVSIASLHSLGMDEIVEPAAELERDENTRRYRGSSLRDYLEHLASADAGPFIERLKIE
ncbi:2-oxoglutarate-dependent dioxygenase 21, chloroplastic-like isoform X2 [Salvia miltiorrhiza]|uniref:2-oxoglutarate-dependent dioxygenase 21, chloroplastic-like isoform X2 n=1 Tax=Salvia miltiorrhiza TaxID=226208 RepID=UPI0025AC04A5|nr:2-oxoglutarate-dependent dioxygenase 21, chloroplastic-like isoform X2 [Salvia miltiorrhiza]